MKISKEKSKYYIFIGGLSPQLTESQLHQHLSKLGPIESITLKMRNKPPFLNLGYGILVTRNTQFFKDLI